jgi:hypothetical protein
VNGPPQRPTAPTALLVSALVDLDIDRARFQLIAAMHVQGFSAAVDLMPNG